MMPARCQPLTPAGQPRGQVRARPSHPAHIAVVMLRPILALGLPEPVAWTGGTCSRLDDRGAERHLCSRQGSGGRAREPTTQPAMESLIEGPWTYTAAVQLGRFWWPTCARNSEARQDLHERLLVVELESAICASEFFSIAARVCRQPGRASLSRSRKPELTSRVNTDAAPRELGVRFVAERSSS